MWHIITHTWLLITNSDFATGKSCSKCLPGWKPQYSGSTKSGYTTLLHSHIQQHSSAHAHTYIQRHDVKGTTKQCFPHKPRNYTLSHFALWLVHLCRWGLTLARSNDYAFLSKEALICLYCNIKWITLCYLWYNEIWSNWSELWQFTLCMLGYSTRKQ